MSLFGEFRKFALRGNVVDLAVGFTVGAAFTTIVKSLVQDIIMPPIGLLLGSASFENLFVVLEEGLGDSGPYLTKAAAEKAGAVTLNYGVFLNNLMAFAVVAVVMFAIVRGVNRVNDALEQASAEGAPAADPAAPKADPSEKKCPFCLSTVPFKATRCAFCTSSFDTERGDSSR